MAYGYYGDRPSSPSLLRELLLDNPPPAIGFDIETISLKERMPIGLSIATSPTDAFWFPCYPDISEQIPWEILCNPKITKVIHNALFDLRAIPLIQDIDSTNIFDTNVAAHLKNMESTRLGDLAPEVGMEAKSAKDMLGTGQTMLNLPIEEVGKKCCIDSRVTLALYYLWKDSIDWDYFKVEMEVIPILVEMSLRGLKVDQRARREYEEKLSTEVEFYKNLAEQEGFNPNSPQQVGYMLAKRGNFLPFTRKKKSLKTSREVLELLDDPMAAYVLNFRDKNTLLSRYIKPLETEDRIYTEYNLDAIVGRISSSNRNLQNIPPGEARHIFLPDNGVFTTGDFSQEHLRILAYWSQDREMKRIYEEGYHDGDIHSYTAEEMHISRRLAKTVNYNIAYVLFTRAAPTSLSQTTKIRDLRRCSEIIDKWMRTFRGATEWLRGAQEYGLRTGYAMPTMFGRHIKLPTEERDSIDGIRRKAANYPIIGSDADIMKRALILCKDLPLVVTMHDSITCDGDIEFPIEQLENIAPFNIPFGVKKTIRWE